MQEIFASNWPTIVIQISKKDGAKCRKKLSAKINQTKEGWSAGRYYMLGITREMVWFNLDLLGNVIYMNQKQFAFFNAMFEFLHFSYFKTQLFDWESLKSPNAIT